MAVTNAPATLAELRTDFLQSMKEVTGNSTVDAVADRYLNKALQDMHQERWPWTERRGTIRTRPSYAVGTVDIAITDLTARSTVTGTGTAWATLNSYGEPNATPGMKLLLGSSRVVHLVGTVGSDTTLTLEASTPWSGTEALVAGSYYLYQDEYALPADFDDVIDIKFFDDDRSIALIGAQEFYAASARTTIRGRPRVATLIELGPLGSTALRRRVVFSPAPDGTYLIPFRYLTTLLAVSATGTGQANLIATTDEPIVPLRYRGAIVYKALELWFGTRQKSAELAAHFQAEYSSLLLRARQKSGPADDRPRIIPAVAGPVRGWSGRRYDGGIAWDELRYR